jgi:hypothetical protein
VKPLGIGLGVYDGTLKMRVTPTSRATDAIWEAVEEARCASMTVKQFIAEAREAWEYHAKQDLKGDIDDFRREGT